jgi:hypothetical protein
MPIHKNTRRLDSCSDEDVSKDDFVHVLENFTTLPFTFFSVAGAPAESITLTDMPAGYGCLLSENVATMSSSSPVIIG